MNQIGVVLVTYNRLEKLKIALQKFSQQTVKPAYIIVVDNASSDGSNEFLQSWASDKDVFEKDVVFLSSNTGGSGGFYEGLSRAIEKKSQWIWVSDDDAFPEKDCLKNAELFIENTENCQKNYSAICGSVVNNGVLDIKHRRRSFNKGPFFRPVPVDVCEYNAPFFINTFSYVGAILNKSMLEKVGLTKKDYFIWYDDTEHSLRLSKVGKIICLPNIVVHHDEVAESSVFSWKTYYGIRNRLDMIRLHFPFYCFLFYCVKWSLTSLKRFFSNREKATVFLIATKDALFKKFGIHPMYRPGWKPKLK